MIIMMKVSKLYKPLSIRAAKFFYLIMELVKLNNMYQFTHEWFKKFFQDFLNHCRWQKQTTESQIKRLSKKFTLQLFQHVSISLFEKDILLFAFLLAYQELDSELKFDMRQVEFFMKGNMFTDLDLETRSNTGSASKFDEVDTKKMYE